MPERMAVIETEVSQIKSDVADIKKDVKTLLAANSSGIGALALLNRAVPWLALLIAAIAAFIKASPTN